MGQSAEKGVVCLGHVHLLKPPVRLSPGPSPVSCGSLLAFTHVELNTYLCVCEAGQTLSPLEFSETKMS